MQKVKVKPFKMIGMAIRTTNENQKALTDIADLWKAFLGKNLIEKITLKTDHSIISLYTDYEGDHTKPYTAILGCKVQNLDNIPDGMVGREFKGGTYMISSARGKLMDGLIANHWDKLWKMDIEREYTADFEVFGEKSQNPEDAEVDFYVAIK